MSCYRILIADPLLGMGLEWPPGVRLVRQLQTGSAGTHWHLLEDPDAPAELEGREVALVMTRGEDGVPVITRRRLVVTHLAVPDLSELRCCGLEPWEMQPPDSMTRDPQGATCQGALAEAVPA